MNRILVTSYVNPDLDGVACMIAYSELLNYTSQNAICHILGTPHDEAKYVLNRFNIKTPSQVKNTDNFEKIVLVDTSQINALENLVNINKVVEIIDHRQLNNSEKFINAEIKIELVGAAATLIAEKFIKNKVKISKKSAILLYSAIVSNTLNFKSSVTTKRDRTVASWLNKVAQLPDNFAYQLFSAKSDLSGKILKRRIVDDFATIEFQDKKRGIAQIEIVGTRELTKNRKNEMLLILGELKESQNLDYCFLSLVDLEEGMNIFVTDHKPSQKLLEKTFGIKFEDDVSELKPFLMRKQIGPLINQMIERNK